MNAEAREVIKSYNKGQKILDGKERARKEKERLALQALKKTKTKPKVSQEKSQTQKIWELAKEYETLWGVYKHAPTFKFFKESPEENSVTYKRLLKAVHLAEEAGVDFYTFVKAQFYCIDKWYGRIPKTYELCSVKSKCNATYRLEVYLNDVKKRIVNPNKNVVSRTAPPPKITKQMKFDLCNRKLRSLMKNWNLTEEEAFLRLGSRTNIKKYFNNQQWLNRNETYCRLFGKG